MMACGMERERLWAWVHGEEEPAAAAALSRHLEACAACAAAVAEMKSLVADLSGVAGRVANQDGPPSPDALPSYRILGKLGEGGMGVVFEAEQQTPRRRVALKVIRGAKFADPYRLHLFRREMQTLARLTHPAIAAIYDAGRTDDGQHYYAMELIRGRSLTDHALGRTAAGPGHILSLRERLALFQRICEAVSYAHQRGVVHRDLKPSNILVDGEGNPKILDFGLARLLEGDEPGATIMTQSGQMLGTLPYMSPEQARGETDKLDVRTDVYSLGVILYELLAGRLPYDVTRKPLYEAVRTICEAAPDPLPRGVPAEAAAITLTALEKETDRRYASAAELGADVRRYLGGYPVRARPGGPLYRLRKAIERNPLTFSLAALVFVVVSGAAVTLAVQANRLAAESARAARKAMESERVAAVLTGLLDAPNAFEMGDSQARVVDVLRAGASRIEEETEGEPIVAAAVRSTLGRTYRGLGDYAEAERHLRFVLETRRKVLGESHLETAAAMNDLGELLVLRDRLDEGEALLRDALRLRERLLVGPHRDIATSLNSIGMVLRRRDRLEEAEDWLLRALAMRERLAATLSAAGGAPRRALTEAHNELAQSINNLASVYRAVARQRREAGDAAGADAQLVRAEAQYRRALDLRRAWYGPQHPEVAKMLNNYARCLWDMGRLPDAEQHLRAALEILRSEPGEQHAYTARTMFNLAALLAERGDTTGARELATAALAVQREVLDPNSGELAQTRGLLERLERPGP